MNTASAAAAYHRRGWIPLPIHPRQKRPVGNKWQSYRPSPDTLEQDFPAQANVGVHLGPSGLVDIDLDCDEAVRLAPRLLPPTPLRFGRDSRPGSHWLYRCENAPFQRLSIGRDTLVELRAGEGKQTVLPPSVHPSGERVRWECDPNADPATVAAWMLDGAVRRIAAAVLLVREGWTDEEAIETVQAPGPPARPIPDKVREWLRWGSVSSPRGRIPGPDDAEGRAELKDAVAAYLRDNPPPSWPRSSGQCPACGHKGCFGTLPGANGSKWSCWSASHEGTACGVASADGEFWHGDVLDLDAHAAGMSVPDFLRSRGYLRQRTAPPPKARPAPASDPEPEPEPDRAPVDALAAVVDEIKAVQHAEQRGELWGRFLVNGGLEALAPVLEHFRSEVDGIFTVLGKIRGMGGDVRKAEKRLKELQPEKKRPNLRLVTTPPNGDDPDSGSPVGEIEPFDLGSEVEVGRRVLKERLSPGDGLVVFDRNAIHRYDEETGAWLDWHHHEVVRLVTAYDGVGVFAGYTEEGVVHRPLKMSSKFAAGAVSVINSETFRRDFFEHRALGCGFKNGFLAADGAWRPKSPEHRLLESEVLLFDYRPVRSPEEALERCPTWFRFLNDVFDGDEDDELKMLAIMQFIGATMLGLATQHQMALLLYGETAGNGKSTLMKVISSLFPPRARACIPPQKMGEKFENVPLAAARVNLVNDMPDGAIGDAGDMKAMIAGDEVQWNPKNQQPYTAKPRAGHIFATNTLPHVNDRSRGFWRRMLVITFNRSFDDSPHRDLHMAEKLLAEREDIAATCLFYALEMGDEGYAIPPSSQEAVTAWSKRTNNVAEFADSLEGVQYVHDGTLGRELFKLYEAHSKMLGTNALGRNRFYDELRRLGFKREKVSAGWLYYAKVVAGSEVDALARRASSVP